MYFQQSLPSIISLLIVSLSIFTLLFFVSIYFISKILFVCRMWTWGIICFNGCELEESFVLMDENLRYHLFWWMWNWGIIYFDGCVIEALFVTHQSWFSCRSVRRIRTGLATGWQEAWATDLENKSNYQSHAVLFSKFLL